MATTWIPMSPSSITCKIKVCDIKNYAHSSSHVCTVDRASSNLYQERVFFGTQLKRVMPDSMHECPIPPTLTIVARIKRKKDVHLDVVIERNKKFRMVNKVKELLCRQENRVMTLKELGLYRRYIGILGDRRLIVFLKRFPNVFEVHNEGLGQVWFRFTEIAEAQYLKELQLKEIMEPILVDKIRKLLMMSIDKTLTVEQLSHVRRDLGLPEDFRVTILPNYPDYFHLIPSPEGEILELTSWDPQLAVSALEHRTAKQMAKIETFGQDSPSISDASHDTTDGQDAPNLSSEEKAIEAIARGKALAGAGTYGPPSDPEKLKKTRRSTFNFPPGFSVSRSDLARLQKFAELPFVSPYAEVAGSDPSSLLAEKRSVAVVHELLSLTLEKRLLCDHFTHFRKKFRLSARLRGMIIRHPEYFYVSEKGLRDTVFLREAYVGQNLIMKDPLAEAMDELRKLVLLGKKEVELSMTLEDGAESTDEDEEEYSLDGELKSVEKHREKPDFTKLKPVVLPGRFVKQGVKVLSQQKLKQHEKEKW